MPSPTAASMAAALEEFARLAPDAALVVNTTSAGMKGNPPLEIDLSRAAEDAAVCDIVYNPLETPLLKDAAARGHRTIDGLGMLMHQAAPSFEAFFRREAASDAGLARGTGAGAAKPWLSPSSSG